MGQINKEGMAVGGSYYQHARLIRLLCGTVDRDNSVSGGWQWDLIKKLIMFRIDHIDFGGHRRGRRGVAAVGQIIARIGRIHPTYIETDQSVGNSNRG